MFDVAVIGRGMIGAAAARHLAEAGLTVLSIGPDEPTDWTTWTGPFASHFDEGRITRISDRHPAWSDVARRSIERYPDIEARSGITVHHPVGLVISTPELPNWLETSQANGAPVDMVEADWVAETTGIAIPDGAPVAFEAAPAGYINPRRLVAAQNLLARQAGASIVARAASSISRSNGGATGFVVGGSWGSFRARRVIVATGAFGHGLLGTATDQRLALIRRPRTVLLAELRDTGATRTELRDTGATRTELRDTGAGAGAWPGQLPSLIMRDQDDERLSSIYWVPPVTYPDGRSYLKIGGVLASDPVIGTGPDPHVELVTWFHGSGDPEEAAALRSALEARLPGHEILSTVTVPCVYTGTTSGQPVIDRVDEGLVVALGGNGAAAKSSDELGRMAAALVADGDLGDDDLGEIPDAKTYGLSVAST